MTASTETCLADVIVVGGGPAGCAAGIRLAEGGHSVLMLERNTLDPDAWRFASGEVLSPHAQSECRGLGLGLAGEWALDPITAVRNVYPDLSWTLHEMPPGLRWLHVDRGGLDTALRRRFMQAGGRIVDGLRVTAVEPGRDHATVHTADGPLHGTVVLDTGGRNSPTVRALGLREADPEFAQILVALFYADFPGLRPSTWDRHFYGRHGAKLSGSRITEGLFRIVLEADLEATHADVMRPVELALQIAEEHDPWMHARMRERELVLPPWAVAPLAFRVSQISFDRVILAGDATGYLSPLSGQGVEFALRMGRLAAAAIHRALEAGDCTEAAFAAYVEERGRELDLMLEAVRTQLRQERDRDVLLRAAHDPDVRARILIGGDVWRTPRATGSLFTTAATAGVG